MPDMDSLDKKSVDVGGLSIADVKQGSGDVLIRIHGGSPGASGIGNYRRNIGALSGSRRVIVPDLPGFGDSPLQPLNRGLSDGFGDHLLAMMDSLGIEKASFVGNSLGGGTTLSIALRHPDRVEKMILMGPGGGYPLSPHPTEGLLRMLTLYDGDGPSMEKVQRVLGLLVFDRSLITPETWSRSVMQPASAPTPWRIRRSK